MGDSQTSCPFCQGAVVVVEQAKRFRRGERSVSVSGRYYQCAQGCHDYEGSEPFRFVDAELGQHNDTALREAWRAKYDEDLPRRRARGRPRGEEPRDQRVQVLLTASELAALDAKRGSMSRSSFLRQALVGVQEAS